MKPTKLAVDENLGRSTAEQLRQAGHDAVLVADLALEETTDAHVLEACASQGRALVTLDFDFANPMRFPPSTHAGLAVVCLPMPASFEDVDAAIDTLARGLARADLSGAIWMVRADRIRAYVGSEESVSKSKPPQRAV